MHVFEDSLVLEVVDDDCKPAPPGEPGSRVLLTNLVNRAQPLTRYELSDAVVLEHEPDPSGRPYLRVARVDGRSNDILRFPAREGGEVAVHPHRLRAPFSAMLDVRQYQLVRLSDGLLVRIVARASAPPDLPTVSDSPSLGGSTRPERRRQRSASSSSARSSGSRGTRRSEAGDVGGPELGRQLALERRQKPR